MNNQHNKSKLAKEMLSSKLAKEMLGATGLISPAIVGNPKTGEKSVAVVWNDHETGDQKVLSQMSPEMAAAVAGHYLRFAIEVAGEEQRALLHGIFTDVLNEEDRGSKDS